MENDSEHEVNVETRHTQNDASNEVAVADIYDEHMEIDTATNTRPYRTNAGAGVEILQIDFRGKGYGAKR